MIPHPTTVDFETFEIKGRPDYPPVPVGVSIKHWGEEPTYYAWGHVNGENTHTKEQALEALKVAYANPDGILHHNGKFDLDVAEVHFGLAVPDWSLCEETMFLLFLDDPNQRLLKLKPSAQRLLGMAPEERDVVDDWLIEHQPVDGVRISKKGGKTGVPAGAYVAYAPPEIVGPYANGDCVRTEALYNLLRPRIEARGMLEAYNRERRLMPILLGMERQGLRVDVDRLRNDVTLYGFTLIMATEWIRMRLEASEDVNLGSSAQLIDALRSAGLLDETKVLRTKPSKTHPQGQISTSKEALDGAVTDPVVTAMLRYRAQLSTCLETFMKPWLEVAERSGEFIYTTWHQTRGDGNGARTGRLSSSPNFQNMPNEFNDIFTEAVPAPIHLPPLPLCRGYILPYEPGHVLLGRDFQSQEIRGLGHFERGRLKQMYDEDPWVDVHDKARILLEEKTGKTGRTRKQTKATGLSIIYGSGAAGLAKKQGLEVAEAKEFIEAYLQTFPGIQEIREDMRLRERYNEPFRTWGGREVYCEPEITFTEFVDGEQRKKTVNFWYKMLNTLIQGSCADATKEALIDYIYSLRQHFGLKDSILDFMRNCPWKLLLQIHDEFLKSVPVKDMRLGMEMLRRPMEALQFSVPMLSEGEYSFENWGSMKPYDEKGVIVYSD